jgi:hypothetical protein
MRNSVVATKLRIEAQMNTNVPDADIAGAWSDHFDRSIRLESTRAKVVLAACYLDELLHQLISVLLKPSDDKSDSLLDGPQAPLGTFSAKIELPFRMGVIDEKTQRSLHLIRKIRNEFAHNLDSCDFNTPRIKTWNEELHRLNDHASAERRATFSSGAVGDFEKSVSWLVYWLKHLIRQIPSACPNCGSEMEHRAAIKDRKPHE